MPPPRQLVLGTYNRKKGGELAALLENHGFQLLTLADFPHAMTVAETGDSFEANATLKAAVQARHLHRWVLGEDSGLCVDALDGAPGVYSARFSGPDADDASNNRRLLEALAKTPPEQRTAHYVCCAALSDPEGRIRARVRGCCRGRIREAPAGRAGFGYDPLFEILEYHRTFGQLGDAVKSVLSHRSRALRRLIPKLLDLAHSGQWP